MTFAVEDLALEGGSHALITAPAGYPRLYTRLMQATSSTPLKDLSPTGIHAILGLDIVDFSTFPDELALMVIGQLMAFVTQALAFHGIGEDAYRWSPAGDGGYITFTSDAACRQAVDVAFSVFESVQRANIDFQIRAGLHAGSVSERQDIGRALNIWGMGINIAARIVSVAAPGQLLISREYHDQYRKDLGRPTAAGNSAQQSKLAYDFGEPFQRTVKHGAKVEVMNASRPGVCIGSEKEAIGRWKYIGLLWSETVKQYEHLISDAMHSRQPTAAFAAAQCLLALHEDKAAITLCNMLSNQEPDPECEYPPSQHQILSAMPGPVLLEVLRRMTLRPTNAGDFICRAGESAESCFLPVSGKLDVDMAGRERKRELANGEIFGEFGMWVPGISRTATVRAVEDGLLLEISHRDFREILQDHEEARNIVHSIIRSRIIEDVWCSGDLFPGLAAAHPAGYFSTLKAECLRLERGTVLDTTNYTYVLLTGRARIGSLRTAPIEIEAGGSLDRLAVAGIESPIGDPDRSRAEVVEDGVGVKIPRSGVRALQELHPRIERAWLALCGQRLKQIGYSFPLPAESAHAGLP